MASVSPWDSLPLSSDLLFFTHGLLVCHVSGGEKGRNHFTGDEKRILFAEGLTVLSIKPSCLPTGFAPALPSVQTFGKISHRK